MEIIEVITNESGDYEIIKADGDIVWSGHSVPHYVFLSLLRSAGVNTKTTEISDEEMEDY